VQQRLLGRMSLGDDNPPNNENSAPSNMNQNDSGTSKSNPGV
jgi:hypothetical protein